MAKAIKTIATIINKEPPKTLPPNTTAQEDLTKLGQRTINKIWEFTQAAIAVMVTISFLYCEISSIDSEAVRMAFALVIGFYFSRTNHSKIGGTGDKTGIR